MNSNSKHIGSDFDDFLAEDGILEQVDAVAIKRVITGEGYNPPPIFIETILPGTSTPPCS